MGWTGVLGVPHLRSVSRGGRPKRLVPSKPSWKPSPSSIPYTRSVPVPLFKGFLRPPHLQKTAAVKDKIEILCSRIDALEELFERPAGEEEETKRRNGLLTYASGLRSDWMPIEPS